MKHIIVILFILVAFLAWQRADLLESAMAQRNRVSRPSKFSKFTHASHAGEVKSLITPDLKIALDCAYCHGTAVRDRLGQDQHDIRTMGYPSHKNGAADQKTHTSCTECHSFTGSGMKREMCTICHDKLVVNPKQMATNLRRFPNPAGTGISEFYDYFSHSEHVDFYEQYILSTTWKGKLKFYDAKLDVKANKGLDRNKFECATCHTANQAPVTIAGKEFKPGLKMSAPAHPECFVCHFDPKLVTPPKPDKPSPKNTFATNCTGCHQATGRPPANDRPVKGSERAVHWFARQIVNTEFNPVKPGVKAPLPYSHKTHFEAVGKSTLNCLSCHATVKMANTRSDFYLANRKTGEKQPLSTSCIDCHKKEMQTKIEGAIKLESAKCNYCHSLPTIREYGTKGIQLPPPSHLIKRPAPVKQNNVP